MAQQGAGVARRVVWWLGQGTGGRSVFGASPVAPTELYLPLAAAVSTTYGNLSFAAQLNEAWSYAL